MTKWEIKEIDGKIVIDIYHGKRVWISLTFSKQEFLKIKKLFSDY